MLRSADGPKERGSGWGLRVALLASARDWHVRRLAAAFRRRGVGTALIRLEDCDFDTASPSGLRLGRLRDLPGGVLVRTFSSGSFEAITRRLGILHALKRLGVPVWNEAAAIEHCVDKATTTFLLATAGLPVPETWAVEGIEAATRIVEREAAQTPLVLKPLFGSQGRGLVLVREASDLPPPDALGDVYYLQRFVGGTGPDYRDYRVFVIAGEPVAAMIRRGENWITNVKRGGKPLATPLDRELAGLAASAAAAVGASFCGIDILRSPDGTPHILEVNSMPAWSGLQTVAAVDIADVLVERFSAVLHTAVERRVA
ncbi:MAG: ATP-grasp domain-containing protein [Propylenella sp.]